MTPASMDSPSITCIPFTYPTSESSFLGVWLQSPFSHAPPLHLIHPPDNPQEMMASAVELVHLPPFRDLWALFFSNMLNIRSK